jgi:hypothetical protein
MATLGGVLGRDLASLHRASARPTQFNLTPMLRGFLQPWEIDPSW